VPHVAHSKAGVGGRLTRGSRHGLVDRGEGDGPDAAPVAAQRLRQHQARQAPDLGGAVLAAGADDCTRAKGWEGGQPHSVFVERGHIPVFQVQEVA
jgi:hypothetical protein